MELIYSYTRKQAIEDGVFVDVSETAKEAGIKYPVALTDTVWKAYVEIPTGVECQDESGRLWDIVWMFKNAITQGKTKRLAGGMTQLDFSLYVRNDNRSAKLVHLKAICGPGDEAEPVITIMMPNED